MDPKWLLVAIFCLSQNLTLGSLTAEDDDASIANDTKHWRILSLTTKTTTSSGKMGSTTRKTSTTPPPKGKTTMRSGQTTRPTGRTPTTTKRSGQLVAATRMSTTTSRTNVAPPLRIASGNNGRISTTTAKNKKPPTLPSIKSQQDIFSGKTTLKPRLVPQPRGPPEKIKQGTTTRRSQTTTTQRPITRQTVPPVLLRMPVMPPTTLSSPFSMYGIQLYSFPIQFSNSGKPSNTTNSTSTTTTVVPVGSNTTETTTMMTTTTTITSETITTTVGASSVNVTSTTVPTTPIEYEDVHEAEKPNPPEYDYHEEKHEEKHNSTTAPTVTAVTVTESPVLSTAGPNMIRKRRKKVTTVTPGPSPGMVRIRVRRKKTTIAPEIETTTAMSSIDGTG